MLEREDGEDDRAFRQRLDAATDRMRKSRDKVFEMVSEAGARDMGGAAASKMKSAYQENPMIAGLAAALVGAVIGEAIPTTQTEDEQLGALGAKALGQVAELTRNLGAQAKETKDEVLDTAVAAMPPTGGAEEPPRRPFFSTGPLAYCTPMHPRTLSTRLQALERSISKQTSADPAPSITS